MATFSATVVAMPKKGNRENCAFISPSVYHLLTRQYGDEAVKQHGLLIAVGPFAIPCRSHAGIPNEHIALNSAVRDVLDIPYDTILEFALFKVPDDVKPAKSVALEVGHILGDTKMKRSELLAVFRKLDGALVACTQPYTLQLPREKEHFAVVRVLAFPFDTADADDLRRITRDTAVYLCVAPWANYQIDNDQSKDSDGASTWLELRKELKGQDAPLSEATKQAIARAERRAERRLSRSVSFADVKNEK